ncbi:MAG: FkbM family methyltransferase [Chloroflexi bacterium]|nr:FkbM family methyltransferase [Chloroflexota bacterium]
MPASKYFEKIARRIGLFKFINFIWFIKIGGTRFKIPVIQEMGLGNFTVTEPWMMDLIQDLYKKKTGAFIDIGANIGQTLLKLKSVAPEVDYVGFEPNPACVYYLRELFKANHFKRSIVIPTGLFNADRLMELLFFGLSEVNSGASIIMDFRPTNKVYERQHVPVFRFDEVHKTLPIEQIAIIKIDVEGAEMEVLQGLQKTLMEQRPFLIMEILPAYNDQNFQRLERQRQIEQFAKEANYSIFRILKTDKERLLGLEDLEIIGIHSDLRKCDYVFIPRI